MSSHKVSVIVPVYNVEKYLERCILSIINQTYKNIEIILVDDGSKDSSGEICDNFAEKDTRIKVIHRVNGGVSDARNAGLDNATGEFIYFIDSDDYIHKDLIKDNLEKLIEKDADIICFNRYIVNNNEVLKRVNIYNKSMGTYDVIEGIWKKKLSNSVCDKICRRKLWNNIRFLKGTEFEDLYATSNILACVQNIICNDNAYYFYNVENNSSIMHTMGVRRYYLEFIGAKMKLNIAKDKNWEDLYQYTIKAAYEYALKAWQYNYIINYLAEEEKQNINKFLWGGQDEKLLSNKYKILLFDYKWLKVLNKIKGLFYYYKIKKKDRNK